MRSQACRSQLNHPCQPQLPIHRRFPPKRFRSRPLPPNRFRRRRSFHLLRSLPACRRSSSCFRRHVPPSPSRRHRSRSLPDPLLDRLPHPGPRCSDQGRHRRQNRCTRPRRSSPEARASERPIRSAWAAGGASHVPASAARENTGHWRRIPFTAARACRRALRACATVCQQPDPPIPYRQPLPQRTGRAQAALYGPREAPPLHQSFASTGHRRSVRRAGRVLWRR